MTKSPEVTTYICIFKNENIDRAPRGIRLKGVGSEKSSDIVGSRQPGKTEVTLSS